MFASPPNRLAALLWNGVDLAVEFATLGEYRLPAPATAMAARGAARDSRAAYVCSDEGRMGRAAASRAAGAARR